MNNLNFAISNQFGNSGKMKTIFCCNFCVLPMIAILLNFFMFPWNNCYSPYHFKHVYVPIQFVIYSFSTKNTMMVKNENIACGQWIMRLTLILMGALFAQKIEQERVCNIEIFYSFLRLDR